MKTPICHRTIGPDYLPANEDYHDGQQRPRSHWCSSRPCIGSECALWVPDTERADGPCTRRRVHCEGHEDDRAYPTHVGWCADNLRRDPWPDPAAEETP